AVPARRPDPGQQRGRGDRHPSSGRHHLHPPAEGIGPGRRRRGRRSDMSVLVSAETKVVVQGITGHQGAVHTRQMKAFGTSVVAGVTPGKGGSTVEETPVFGSVREAVSTTGANASCIFVPAPYAKDALL